MKILFTRIRVADQSIPNRLGLCVGMGLAVGVGVGVGAADRVGVGVTTCDRVGVGVTRDDRLGVTSIDLDRDGVTATVAVMVGDGTGAPAELDTDRDTGEIAAWAGTTIVPMTGDVQLVGRTVTPIAAAATIWISRRRLSET